jgi:glycerol-3-phosphate dehydrogenase
VLAIFDVLVVGGGIHGAAVARDASLRGLSVLLLEAGDFASGTSSRTSKLIHGGIRYLETAQFGLVREALRERSILLETAPTFVRPLPFMIPHYRGEGRPAAWVALGLALYAALAGRHSLAAHRRLGAADTLSIEPGLRRDGLVGSSLFWDAQMDDALLCVAIAVEAARAGAELKTHTPLASLRRDGASWRARHRDSIDGSEGEVSARFVVNAAGPWADAVRAMAAGVPRASMRRTRGTHVVLPGIAGERALLLTARRDGRVFFVLPWGRYSLIGTTDADEELPPERVAPPREDIRYLIEEAGAAFPAAADGRRPVRAFAGVRPLARSGAGTPWSHPRGYRLISEDGMITIVGGKYTTHRSLAERVVDRVVAMTRKPARPCGTATAPIGADRAGNVDALRARHPATLDLGDALVVAEAEVVHAVTAERARRLDDVLLRRTRLWLDSRALRGAAAPVASWMAPHLGWGGARIQEEVEQLTRALDEEERSIEEAAR